MMKDRKLRRVVCAACRKDGVMILGARHFDETMITQMQAMSKDQTWGDAEQGFIDQWGKFMTRAEAFVVATIAKQIIQKTGNRDSYELFSEDIY